MIKKIRKMIENTNLAAKIRYSYVLILLPMLLLSVIMFVTVQKSNSRYEVMINSLAQASEFSLDFKKDYDYETYLLIVGNKSAAESPMHDMLVNAEDIVLKLMDLTASKENNKRLESAIRYITNLRTYQARIEENLSDDEKYEDNIEIWENDVQIVTELLNDTIQEYIYYEVKDLQSARVENQRLYLSLVRGGVIASIIIFLSLAVLSYYIPLSITRPIRTLTGVTDQVAKGDLTVRADVQSGEDLNILSESLNTMIDKINDLIEKEKSDQARLRKAEFELLQSQINPHFLYNTLDAIVWSAEAGNQKQVVKMVGSLSEFFRTSLNQGKDIVTVREEIQHVRSYLEIQQIRYQDILKYEIDVDESIMNYMIPKITLQPLVENAIYHGIKNRRRQGRIIISSRDNEDDFLIEVKDNGIGMTQDRLSQVMDGIRNKAPSESDIYGLYNVNERIKLNFGQEYGLAIESVYEEGSTVSIRLPHVID
ncbi:MAG: sensor histidine kinase [Lachnospiraceae bacterium]|nr:sensor histidine kinase [Lachnospiraceae bacterium]